MKYFIKGIGLGISLCVANKLCCLLFDGVSFAVLAAAAAIIFFAVTTAFLVSRNVPQLLLCGFTGLFVMFFAEICTLNFTSRLFAGPEWLAAYIGGFYGSMAAIVVSIILTARKVNLLGRCNALTTDLKKDLKIKLLIYAVVSAIGFSYLAMPESSGVSVPVFALMQLICLWLVVPDRKRLLLFIPVMVMALNSFWSANYIWRVSNFLVSLVLFGCMFMRFDFKSDSLQYLADAVKRVLAPLPLFRLPFEWGLELNKGKTAVVKRVVLALIIAVPCALLLIVMLSNADMVFSLKTESFLDAVLDHVNFHTVFVGVCGIVVGLYLFGAVCNAHAGESKCSEPKEPRFKGDLLIINILLFVILSVYTLFVIVQFKYLFAGAALPDGLTYTEYARKGFFELLALTGINIAAILAVIRLTKCHSGKWPVFTKALCHYLCAVTVVLLVSSFYRMWLYTNDDGLTRLRLFVMGFLVFEAIGLFVTFVYIAKPRFNITLVYICLALVYYTVLNILPTDNIIAKNQIDKYLNGGRERVEYVFTLSADAAPAMEFLYNHTNDEEIKTDVKYFLENRTRSDIPQRWQRYNLSTQRAKEILKAL